MVIVAAIGGCGGTVETSGSTSTGGTGGTTGGTGGASTGGDGGAGGVTSTGGKGGAGGVTSTGGAGGTGSTCTPDDFLTAAAQVGFLSQSPLASSMTITSLTQTTLSVKAPDGTGAAFIVEGVDLMTIFTVGEVVQVTGWNEEWQTVATSTHFAAAHYLAGFGSSPGLPPMLDFGGPSLQLTEQCHAPGQAYWALLATFGDEVTIPCHETRALGDYVIHNGGIYDWSAGNEFGFGESIVILGPVPPPP